MQDALTSHTHVSRCVFSVSKQSTTPQSCSALEAANVRQFAEKRVSPRAQCARSVPGSDLDLRSQDRSLSPPPGCQAVRCCQVICRAVGQLSDTVRCLCQTSCQVLSVLSGAVGCVSDSRGALQLSGAVGAVGCCCQTLSELSELSGCCCCQTLGCCCQVLSGGAVGVLSGSDTHQPHL